MSHNRLLDADKKNVILFSASFIVVGILIFFCCLLGLAGGSLIESAMLLVIGILGILASAMESKCMIITQMIGFVLELMYLSLSLIMIIIVLFIVPNGIGIDLGITLLVSVFAIIYVIIGAISSNRLRKSLSEREDTRLLVKYQANISP